MSLSKSSTYFKYQNCISTPKKKKKKLKVAIKIELKSKNPKLGTSKKKKTKIRSLFTQKLPFYSI